MTFDVINRKDIWAWVLGGQTTLLVKVIDSGGGQSVGMSPYK